MSQGHAQDSLQVFARSFGLEVWGSDALASCRPAFELLPLTQAQALGCVILRDAQGDLVAVMHDPFDADLWTQVGSWAGAPLQHVLAVAGDIQAYLAVQESLARAMDMQPDFAVRDGVGETGVELSLARLGDAASPAVRLVDSTLYDAIRAGASDVHIESTAAGLTVRYRIDGVLETVTEVPGLALPQQAISRLKVLAELDIAEQRVPQDGSFRVTAQGRQVDLRLSIIPGQHGEDAVVRILDRQAMQPASGRPGLGSLGFDTASVTALRAMVEAAHGMLLVAGPTGSGKTTTLYGALMETWSGQDKVITIEDPVEYQLPGVLQIPVNEKKGLTFARGLRSVLRHDPDTIMVGEIRDAETAEIAVQSALTGHRVLTTLHANNVFDVFGRFNHMGLDPYGLVSALNGIWAQRLLRLNCPHCSRPCKLATPDLLRLGLNESDVAGFALLEGSGCGQCRGTGYKGRQAIAQVLRLDDEVRELVLAQAPPRQLKEAAQRKGTRSLAQAGLDLVRTGRTTLGELRRVTLAS